MAKLNDVAERAGVSITTASMALSGKGRISQEIRNKVIEAADKLEYKKNKPANNKNWVLILNMDRENDYLSYFFNPIIRHIQSSAREKGFILSLLPISDKDSEESIYRDLMEMKISSVLALQYVSVELFKKLELINIPCVVINNPTYQDELFTVCVDDFQGAYEGTMKLIRAGHKNISCIDYQREKLPGILADRFLGFRKALEEHNLSFSENSRLTVNILNNKEMENRIKEFILNSSPKTTALFIHDDMMALKVIKILEKLEIKVPDDISIIAPGDTLNYNQIGMPQISTMRIDNSLMGNYATDMMIERIKKGSQNPHVLKIKQTYFNRNSIKNI